MKQKKPLGLYVHIPFCRSKCDYCDFCSIVPNSNSVVEHYTDALILQMEDYSARLRPYLIDTVYIGGGTPTSLDEKRLTRIIENIYRNFKIAKKAEFTIEANPATCDLKSLRRLRKLGVNRLSMGLQSVHDNELRALGRIHTFADLRDTYEAARTAGFDNVSLDLMYGIPEQTEKSFAQTLSTVTALEPDHISMYALKIEDGTPFARRKDSLVLPDEDTQYSMYMNGVEYLASRGFERYEISNFARGKKYSAHNLKYWHCEEYFGLGAAAHSFLDGERISTTRNIRDFIDGLEIVNNDINVIDSKVAVKGEALADDYVMLAMRLSEGVNVADFNAKFGIDFNEKYGALLDDYVDEGFVEKDERGYRFTSQGMFVSNYILSDVLGLDEE
jgi:oxygen-independent coproporphyrinogen-3 oxidase